MTLSTQQIMYMTLFAEETARRILPLSHEYQTDARYQRSTRYWQHVLVKMNTNP